MKISGILFLTALLSLSSGLMAASDDAKTDLLGQEYRSELNGIAFRPPANCTKIVSNVPDQIVEFDDPDLHWTLKVTRRTLEDPLPLTAYKDQFGNPKDGIMEISGKQLSQQPVAQLVSQDITYVGDHGQTAVGLLTVRYDRDLERRLAQQAIVQANNQLYYVVDLDTPARANANMADDSGEHLAMNTFKQLVSSINLLDMAATYQDQTARLVRTEALIANWTPGFLKAHVVPEQFFRVVRDGRDIGYAYEVETVDDKAGSIAGVPVVRIGIRSYEHPSDGSDLEVESILSVSLDRKHEEFSSQATKIDTVQPPQAGAAGGASGVKPVTTRMLFSELGISNVTTEMLPVVPPANGDVIKPVDPLAQANQLNPGWTIKETRSLKVERHGINLDNPSMRQDYPEFKQQMPEFYVPQALSHMAVRMLPIRDPKTYLFAVYVADGDKGNPAIMMRYLDVALPAEVKLDGKVTVAVAVKDRLGIDGAVTTHYLDADDGTYLGSVSEVTNPGGIETTQTILPADGTTLKNTWPNCNLTPPEHFEDAAPAGK